MTPAPNSEAKLRTVARAMWALPFTKKLVVIAIIAALTIAEVAINPDVASSIWFTAGAVERGL